MRGSHVANPQKLGGGPAALGDIEYHLAVLGHHLEKAVGDAGNNLLQLGKVLDVLPVHPKHSAPDPRLLVPATSLRVSLQLTDKCGGLKPLQMLFFASGDTRVPVFGNRKKKCVPKVAVVLIDGSKSDELIVFLNTGLEDDLWILDPPRLG